jgi:hypothetical protein
MRVSLTFTLLAAAGTAASAFSPSSRGVAMSPDIERAKAYLMGGARPRTNDGGSTILASTVDPPSTVPFSESSSAPSAPTPTPSSSTTTSSSSSSTIEEASRINKIYGDLRKAAPGELLAEFQSAAPEAIKVQTLALRAENRADGSLLDVENLSGDWQLVYQYNSKQATKSQKAFDKPGLPQYSNFITDDQGRDVFRNIVAVTKSRVKVVADVEWDAPTAENPRRLGSTICRAGIEVGVGRRFGWKPLRLPLPLRGVGWLDVTYLSESMRITRGNRGGLFVHVRPELLPAGRTSIQIEEGKEE